MSKQAFEKIKSGLDEAIIIAPYVAEIERLRAEVATLRAELEAIKSPPDYGTQKTMNEQLHYASVIAQKDREIERLRAAAAALKETGDE